MATLRDIRSRIKGVKSTQQITKAMKMVAAAKLRKAQDRMLSSRPYAKKVKELLYNLAGSSDVQSHVLMTPKTEIKNVAILVVTSDRGLCGAFNSNVLKNVVNLINTEYKAYQDSGKLSIIAVGRKGYDFFRKRGYQISYYDIGLFNNLSLSSARAITNHITENFLAGKYDLVLAAGNEFKNVATARINVGTFLPITVPTENKTETLGNYIFEPNQEVIIDNLIPMQLQTQVWQMLLESFASEQGARMTAMESATDNAKELLRSLSLNYNRLRQAAITKELAEIVSGAEALKS